MLGSGVNADWDGLGVLGQFQFPQTRFSIPVCGILRAMQKKARKKAPKKIVIRIAIIPLERVPIPKPDKDSKK